MLISSNDFRQTDFPDHFNHQFNFRPKFAGAGWLSNRPGMAEGLSRIAGKAHCSQCRFLVCLNHDASRFGN
jgi:hypothetical protein